jgi:RecA/RadA recombinase
MKKRTDPARLPTGVRHLDEILNGGLPKGSVTVVAGAPGSGKTILAQQICFHNASARSRVLSFTTLSNRSPRPCVTSGSSRSSTGSRSGTGASISWTSAS